MTDGSNGADSFTPAAEALASPDQTAIAHFLHAQIENIQASGLDARTFAISRLAALIALDAPVQSYAWVMNLAKGAGVTDAEVQGIVVALTPTVGYARILSAGEKMRKALELL